MSQAIPELVLAATHHLLPEIIHRQLQTLTGSQTISLFSKKSMTNYKLKNCRSRTSSASFPECSKTIPELFSFAIHQPLLKIFSRQFPNVSLP